MIAPELDHPFEQLARTVDLADHRGDGQIALGGAEVLLLENVVGQLIGIHGQGRQETGEQVFQAAIVNGFVIQLPFEKSGVAQGLGDFNKLPVDARR